MSRTGVPKTQTVTARATEEATEEKEQEWRAGFEAMGYDPDTNNVEYALPAAREVLFPVPTP